MIDASKVLRFLQAHKFDLMREVPGFVDAQLSKDGEARVTLRVTSPLATPPACTFEGDEIPIDLQVDFPDSRQADKVVVVAGNMAGPTVVGPVAQAPGQVGTVATPNEKAVGPHEAGGRNSTAYEAWRHRHRHVKVV
jgi:hypothetical protein